MTAASKIETGSLLEAIRLLLHYDPETGNFQRLTPGRRRVGSLDAHGYLIIKIGNRSFKAHRVGWALACGEWPQGVVDHINGNRQDNRLANLRDIPAPLNAQNTRRVRKNSVTGVRGVYPEKGRYRSVIGVGGQRLYLGTYDTVAAAEEVYARAKAQFHLDGSPRVATVSGDDTPIETDESFARSFSELGRRNPEAHRQAGVAL